MELVWNKLDSLTLCYGNTWDDVKTSVKAKVFGQMVLLGQDRIKHYKSDLYHDALWLENFMGPGQFDWVARESGTFIGASAAYCNLDDWDKPIKYRFEIIQEDLGKWTLTVYEASPYKPNSYEGEQLSIIGDNETGSPFQIEHETLPIKECSLATTAAGCIYHPAPVVIIPKQDLSETATHYYNYLGTEYVSSNPTPRNVNQTRKGKFNMDQILQELREKLDEANSARDEAYDAKSQIDDVVSELDEYIDSVDDLIANLENLPEVSVDLDVRVSFDS